MRACKKNAKQKRRTASLLSEIRGDPALQLLLPKSVVAGAVLEHASNAMAKFLSQGPTVFKIGITHQPHHRWHNTVYGYKHDLDRYQKMVLLFITADPIAAAFLEAALIDRFTATPGCRNKAKGGENLHGMCSPYFTYVVLRCL